ncbi:5-hydroxytryptamine receptor 1 [Patella vulgata]|uniref:5-hydroxytryptamine receptor 1 n=1 Tax=Patella vulgata TaxID=6465 RepID=UPI00217F7C0F|nr:5-hydroxytryptamine receptor 1 [Patella vulgata]
MADSARDVSFVYDNISRQNVTDLIVDMFTNVTTTSSNVNDSAPQDTGPPPAPYPLWVEIIIAVIIVCLIIGTVVGNSLVCIAVGIVKRLQSPSNLLIVSLAVSDLLVALLVMPFAMFLDIKGAWLMGDALCDVWTSLDVMLCTASILNLCMISVDRYFVITRPFQYAMKRTPKRMLLMIAVVWVSSGLISIPPAFGWKTERPAYVCLISQKLGYQIYATIGAFYLPLAVMIVVYFKIWRVSSRIAKAENRSKVGSFDKGVEFQVGRRSKDSGDSHTLPNGTLTVPGSGEDDEILPKKQNSMKRRRLSRFNFKSLLPRNQRMNHSLESKATKTLGIIMGGFTACWLPFFILALVRPFCGAEEEHCQIPYWLTSALMWLGYANSFLNPVIYARFNREFRTPFKEILCFRCKGINTRMRSESYVEQYGHPDPSYKDSLKPTTDTVVKYNSHGQTVVALGNGSANGQSESRI